MSLLRNLLGNFMPHLEARSSAATLAAINAEVVHNLSGDASAVIYLNGTGTLNATYAVDGSADGVNYFPLLCYPYGTASLGGFLPQSAQPLVQETVVAATVIRALCTSVGGLQKVRVRLTAYVSGSYNVTINSDDCKSINPYANDLKAATLMVSATAAAATAVTATLPAVVGLRHYIDRIDVVRSATAALTAAATPVSVTTTNIPGLPVLTFGWDTGGIGVDKMQSLDFGASGMAAISSGTATTIVCPLYPGVVWRVNVVYRLGL
jgi:hypothetical protein